MLYRNLDDNFIYLFFNEDGEIFQRELSADNIQLAYGGISRIRASYYKDREGKPLHMYI